MSQYGGPHIQYGDLRYTSERMCITMKLQKCSEWRFTINSYNVFISFTSAENTHKLFVSQVKLMNIEGAAKLDLSDYKGIFLPPDWSPSDPQVVITLIS